MLHHHFRKPRLLSVGDVIAISKQNFQSSRTRIDKSHSDKPPVYIVVQALTDNDHESLWVQKGETSLVLNKEVPSRIPTLAKTPPFHPIFNTGESIFRKIQGMARFIEKSIDGRESRRNDLLFLISGPSKSGKTLAVRTIAHGLGLQLRTINGDDLTGDTASTAEKRIKNCLEETNSYGSCVLHLKKVDLIFDHIQDKQDSRLSHSFAKTLRQLVFNEANGKKPIVVIMTTSNVTRIPSEVTAAILSRVEMKNISKEETIDVLKTLLSESPCSSLFDWKAVASMMGGSLLGNLVDFASSTQLCMTKRLEEIGSSEEAELCGPLLSMEDAMNALKRIQMESSKNVGAPQIPSVKWSDIGGLEEAKKNILDTVQSPLRHFRIAHSSLSRSGVLLYGPPGTGKTLLAKAVATECSMNFLSVKGPELINMYVGQSEENVRRVFEKARSVEPCIIFFDELDSLAPRRGGSADSGGVLDRVVSQLLAEMDGMAKSEQVFVIGATNRPDLLDPAVLRPGRLDRLIYVDIPEEPEVKLKVLKALTRKMQLDSVDLEAVSVRCPKTFTGADLYSLCATAYTSAMARCIEANESVVVVTDEDFRAALVETKPSVGDDELAHYRNLRKQFGS
ncbi:peroxisome assembly factor 2-like [Galendromus occidentalis]|uniref:Peroxisomal ATPase PEX6 n=1 Tax=Galendromus occidentalis TaxID=34638 RepID=A0AAJ6QWV4_9ACAR|nr:peroxisome assembly factor 2-like [Galendromus occidentalis]